MLDNGLAAAEACLAKKREAELRAWVKVIEQRLPVIAAQLGLLLKMVTGMVRPMPSEIQLTMTGSEMTVEEHLAIGDPAQGAREMGIPHRECREVATHPLDEYKEFGGLTVTKRRRALKDQGLCECCLTSCRDKEIGTKCYHQGR